MTTALQNHAEAMNGQLAQTRERLQALGALAPKLGTAQGISLLELKTHTLLQYMAYLAYFVAHKAAGRTVEGHPLVERLAELRIVLEKIRPLEEKLQYQIDKLVRAAEAAERQTGESGPRDALDYAPNLAALGSDDDAEDAPASGDDANASRPQEDTYQPPKIAPAFFDEDAPAGRAERKRRSDERQLERVKQRAASSRMMQDLLAEQDERPEERSAAGVDVDYARLAAADRNIARFREKQAYEEENFTRLPVTRLDRRAERDLRTEALRATDELQQLGRDIDDISRLDELARASGGPQRGILARAAQQRAHADAAVEHVAGRREAAAASAGAGFERKAALTQRRIAARARRDARRSSRGA